MLRINIPFSGRKEITIHRELYILIIWMHISHIAYFWTTFSVSLFYLIWLYKYIKRFKGDGTVYQSLIGHFQYNLSYVYCMVWNIVRFAIIYFLDANSRSFSHRVIPYNQLKIEIGNPTIFYWLIGSLYTINISSVFSLPSSWTWMTTITTNCNYKPKTICSN